MFMKIALVHDHLISDGGGERVLKAFTEVWPDAPIYTLLHHPEKAGNAFDGNTVHTSSLQKWPLSISRYHWYLPLRPKMIEQFDLSQYDVVLSNSSSLAKGVITTPRTLHINYCHTPTRFLWINPNEPVDALEKIWPISSLSRSYREKLRTWDINAVDGVNVFTTNSENVKQRVKEFYHREATRMYPPVYTHKLHIGKPQDYFLTGGRLVSYKRFDITVQAFNRLNIPLKIFGVGPELAKLKRMALPNIEFLGQVSNEAKAKFYAEAKAFIHPQVEDFGITPVESMACGRPVIAYKEGGALETVVDGKTGIFFNDQDWASLADAVIRFNESDFDPIAIKHHAEQFSASQFRRSIKNFVEEQWEGFKVANKKAKVMA